MLSRFASLQFILVAALCFAASNTICLAQQGNLLEVFTTTGVKLTSSASPILEAPLLVGKPAESIKPTLEKLSERHGWDRFSKNSPTSPVNVQLSYVHEGDSAASNAKDAEKRVGHNIYSAFIAYAQVASLKDEQLMSSLFGSSAEDKELMGFSPQSLSADTLKLAGIDSVSAGTRYSTLRIPLMNRIVIEGTARIDRIESGGAIVIAWQLDPRFTFENAKDIPAGLVEYANRYRKEERDDLGKLKDTPPVSYLGCGGYLSVQPTGLADNQLLIESRFALHEPQQWFAGSNFLRSKFPAALQESAQTFRRKLANLK